jgi:hypothetical protein
MRAVDERGRQFEPGAQTGLDPGHASIISLVVVTGQVQHAVEYEDFQFVRNAMAVKTRVVAGDLGGDGDIAAGGTREGEDIGGLVFAAKAVVELAKALVAGNKDIHVTLDLGQSLGLADETLDLRRGYTPCRNCRS